jgi:TldD protein
LKEYLGLALDAAKQAGAVYADIRIIHTRSEDILVRNSTIGSFDRAETLGFGIRVIAGGAWGFASSPILTRDEIVKVTRLAVETAKASGTLKQDSVRLVPEPVHQDDWQTPYIQDPFKVPIEKKLDLLYAIDRVLRAKKEIAVAESGMSFLSEHQWLWTTEGTRISQSLLRSGAGYSATSSGPDDVQVRSYPASHGGQQMTMGYELVESLGLLENAERVRDEAIALLSAKPCPSGVKDVIIDGSQLALQIHESVGHATELDRVLGMEEDFAGKSFATTEKAGTFRYGSDLVNIVADSTIPGGLATIGYDDDGVRAQRWFLIRNGLLTGYLTNRETAAVLGEERSRGCNRAEGYANLPITRQTNICLLPGNWELDALIADTREGIYFETNRSWSIDHLRLNFQFGTEIAWEIKKGKLAGLLKNPNYQSVTPEFWGSCDAVCNESYWKLWGVANCGKGQPVQLAEMSHGAAPARFRKITVGIEGK